VTFARISLAVAAAVLAAAAAPRSARALDVATAPAAPHSAVSVSQAWIPSPPPGSDVGAAYLTLHNEGHDPAVVVDVSSPIASAAMFHATHVDAREAQMRMLKQLTLAPGETLVLKPGAVHIMLHGLKRRLTPGEQVPLELVLADGEKIGVTAQVRPLGSQ
jgi:copper(I)-binding protein